MNENIILQNEENILIITFKIEHANQEITLKNLVGMTEIDWGDGAVNNELIHTYTEVGEYICKAYGVTTIGTEAFFSCSSLTSITIPNSVTSIGNQAFTNCSSLTSIEIGGGVTSIGSSSFQSCGSLTSIEVDENNKNYKSIDGVLYSKDGTTLIRHPDGKKDTSFIVPNSVTSIYSYAFSDCSSLVSIKIPDGVTSIATWTFEGCRSLTSVEIPDSVTTIGEYAFVWCSSLTSVEIPDSVTSIGNQAFANCRSLTSVIFKSLNPLDTLILQNSKINDSNPTYYVPTKVVEVYQTAWVGIVDPSRILPNPEDILLINLIGLRTYHKALKEKHLDNKLDKTGGLIGGDLSVQGNLNVTGTTTTKDTETVLIKDNVIVANSDGNELLEEAGFAVKTGADAAYGIMYDPAGDGVKIGLGAFDENGKFEYGIKEDGVSSEAQFLATRDDTIADGNLVKWDDTEKKLVDAGNDYVKHTDYASKQNYGLVRLGSDGFEAPLGIFMNTVYPNFGVDKHNGGGLTIAKARYAEIDARSPSNYSDGGANGANHCKPIVPANADYTVFAVLTDPKIEVTEEQKEKICETISALPKIFNSDVSQSIIKISKDGVVTTNQITAEVVGGAVVERAGSGNIKVPETPTDDSFATSKKYVDDNFIAKPTDISGFNRVCIINNGSTNTGYLDIMAPAQFTSETDAKRRGGIARYTGGRLGCAPPERDYEATPKKYVEDNFVAKSDLAEKPFEIIEKFIIGYILTESQPEDWETNYTAYYVNTGTDRIPEYTAVTGDSAPTWETNKYYLYDSATKRSAIRRYEPDGTPYAFKKVVLYAKAPKSEDGNVAGYAAFETDWNNEGTYGTQPRVGNWAQTSGETYVTVRAEVSNGRIFATAGNSTNNYTMSIVGCDSLIFAGTDWYKKNTNATKITCVNIPAEILPGTEVYIHAVRA